MTRVIPSAEFNEKVNEIVSSVAQLPPKVHVMSSVVREFKMKSKFVSRTVGGIN